MNSAQRTAHARSSLSGLKYKLTLLVGFILFGLGVYAAHRAPASGYEVSIYWATPATYWVGTGGALLLALATLLYNHKHRLAPLSMLLATTSFASFLALPVIRNYYFHGYADPMTHLGFIRALASGYVNFLDPVYPGTYVVTVSISSLTGLPVNRSMLYVMFVFGLLFLAFVPLTVRAIIPDRRALLLGLFSAFLLLPVNNISLFYRFHPFSLTTLYFSVVAYLFVSHVTNAHEDSYLPARFNATTLLLPLATTALLLFHPQATVDLLIIFAMVLATQVLVRRFVPTHPLAEYRSIHVQFTFLAVLFLLWVSIHQAGAGRLLDALADALFGWISGQPRPQNSSQHGQNRPTLSV